MKLPRHAPMWVALALIAALFPLTAHYANRAIAEGAPVASGQTGNPLSQLGDHWMSGGGQPTLSSGCGTAPIIVGSDTAGHLRLGTATSQPCTLTFSQAFIQPPTCVVTAEGFTVSYTRNRTTINLTALVDSAIVHWICAARAGG